LYRDVVIFKILLIALGVLAVAACADGDTPASPTAAGSPAEPTAQATLAEGPVAELPEPRTLSVGAPVAFPEGVALVVEVGCWQCDGDPGGLVRIYRDSGGVLLQTELLGGGRNGHVISPDGSQIAYASCTRGTCDGFNPAPNDVQTTIGWSHDGGITSETFAPLDGLYGASAVARGMLLAVGQAADGSPLPMLRYPGGEAFTLPAGADSLIATGWDQISFLTRDRTTLLLGPDVAPLNLGKGRQIDGIAPADVGGRQLAIDWSEPALDGEGKRYKSIAVLDGQRYRIERTWEVDPAVGGTGGWLDEGTLIATYRFFEDDLPTHGGGAGARLLPALFDLKIGVVHPIVDPFLDEPYARGRNFVLAVIPGTFARVVNTGDCLNLRSEPRTAAPVKVCAADAVLLRLRDQQEVADGVTWELVEMTDGTDGWASAEFLAR
jgi:hypothetical protein